MCTTRPLPILHGKASVAETQRPSRRCRSLKCCAPCRSSDGNTLIMSSQDGYCSLVAFGPGELGTPLSAAAAALYTAAVETPDISSTPVPASHPPTEREALGTPVVARVRDSMLEQPSPLTQCVQGINRLPCSPHGMFCCKPAIGIFGNKGLISINTHIGSRYGSGSKDCSADNPRSCLRDQARPDRRQRCPITRRYVLVAAAFFLVAQDTYILYQVMFCVLFCTRP